MFKPEGKKVIFAKMHESIHYFNTGNIKETLYSERTNDSPGRNMVYSEGLLHIEVQTLKSEGTVWISVPKEFFTHMVFA